MCSKVEKSSLIFDIKIEDDSETSTAKRNHGCGLVIRFGYVALKVVLVINEFDFSRFNQIIGRKVAASLNELAVHEVVNGRGEQLTDVAIVKAVSQHSTCS